MKLNTWIVMCDMHKDQGYIRVFGFGFRWKDVSVHPLLFSERTGVTKRIEIGNYSFTWLKRI